MAKPAEKKTPREARLAGRPEPKARSVVVYDAQNEKIGDRDLAPEVSEGDAAGHSDASVHG